MWWAPQAVAREAAAAERGLGTLCGWLVWEWALVRPQVALGALLRLPGAPVAALHGLWAALVGYAIRPMFITMLAGLVLYYAARRRPETRVDVWGAMGALGYAYIPHVVVCSLGAAARAFAGAGPWGSGLARPTLSFELLAAAPSVALGLVMARALLRPAPASAPPNRRTARAASSLIVAALVAGAVGTATTVTRHWDQLQPVRVGDVLPHFLAQGIDRPDLDSDTLAGKVVLLDFWATWCAPCMRSLPHVQALHARLARDGLAVVALSIETGEAATVRQGLADAKLSLPAYIDDGSVQQRFHVHTYPTSFLVGRDGIVRHVYDGPAEPEALAAAVGALLAE